ncbi:shikimate dehydrogenase [Marinicella litoralis]|uniref:Shikimate dehydrogenase (NADP(+)) n=1 Tax=Marinicella litoralis TaxID=644220 RepID=A0A4R6XXA3_9GAMM|nr:shikimate dehydrogenase [Marinicella litoralis]TDR23219.1 shikimate dehydrogenase [Marinicella litoralis]
MAEPIKTFQLGLLGHPVAHSQSPRIHAAFAKQFGISLNYQLIDTTAANLPADFKQWIKTAHGCNVTLPHKSNIMPLLDHYTERAHLTQAVNTVYWQADELWGDNTDGDGLVLDLINKHVTMRGACILIIGAGGATQGIIPALIDQGVMRIDIKNRDAKKAENLALQFEKCHALKSNGQQAYDLIIHATSMGHQGHCPELEKHWFHDNTIAYDLSYGDAAAPFLSATKVHGAKQVFDGLGMLYGQAALAFNIWFGKKPEVNIP